MRQMRSASRATLLVAGLYLISVLACALLSQPRITGVMLARGVEPPTLDPVEETDTYSWEQPQFHAVVDLSDATAGTLVRAVWTAVDVGGAAPPNTTIADTETRVQGNHRLVFSAPPSFGRWPPGSYRLDVYLDGVLDRAIDFAVVAPAPTPLPTAPQATSCPPIPTPIVTPSEIITGVMMALDVDAETKEPIHPTTKFSPVHVFHAVVGVDDAPAGTTVTATWYATDLGDTSTCNVRLYSTDIVVDESRNIDFTLESETPWQAGKYRVEIAVNWQPAEIMTFEVVAGQ